MTSLRRTPARSITAMLVGIAMIAGAAVGTAPAYADTAPVNPTDPATPVTVAADVLPTTQIDGVAWSQVVVGNTVYVAGRFATARPAGSAAGQNTTPRNNLLAYDIRTGELISNLAPNLNAQALAVTASPDGSRIYVVGDFTSIDGQGYYRIAAFDTATNKIVPSFRPILSSQARSVAATNSTVYVGGIFKTANGVSRNSVAALDSSTGSTIAGWDANADASVEAIALTKDGSKVILGGRFANVGGAPAYGLAAVSTSTGGQLPWAAGAKVRNGGTKAAITSLYATDDRIYGSGYVFGGLSDGNLEGIFSADPASGEIVWIEDCHGDTYSVFATGNTVYGAGHPYYCGNVGGFPETNPRTYYHTMAYSKAPTQTITRDPKGYFNWEGNPAPSILNFFPKYITGTATGQGQAAWSVSGNSDYIVAAGEFPFVNNIAQQGLVRYAVPSKAPNKVGPNVNTDLVPVPLSVKKGEVRLSWLSTYDQDNVQLTYKLVRDGNVNAPIYTTTQVSNFYTRPQMGFIDKGLAPGSNHTYRLYVNDPFGNTVNRLSPTVTVASADAGGSYAAAVQADSPEAFWPLSETSGAVGYDNVGFRDLQVRTGSGRGADGPAGTTATTFDGSSTGFASTASALPAPNTFTAEAWVRTTSTSGGKIIGYGSSSTADSNNYDRQVYFDNDGRIWFGVNPNGLRTVTSSASYNDGQWHHVVATLGASGMRLFVDGKTVGQRNDATSGEPFSGYWRVGGDNLGGWPGQPASSYLKGDIADVASYPTALDRNSVINHFVASGRTSPIPGAPTDAYGSAVFGEQPLFYWRLNETTGNVANDALGENDGTYFGTVSKGVSGALADTTDKAAAFDGGLVSSDNALDNPRVYSLETWFNTTTDRGGKLIGFGSQRDGLSGAYDRHVYMQDDGRLVFGTYTGQLNTITSDTSYNDGRWHQVVASQDADGMKLYVDGKIVGTNPQTDAQAYAGYWRIGGDNTWGSSSPWFNGKLDEAAVYSTAITAQKVQQHWVLGGGAPNVAPTASFTSSSRFLTASFDSSASADSDGRVVSRSWDFGDGTTSSDTNPVHGFASGGTYQVTLTVTDDSGTTGSVVNPITVTPRATPAIADAYGAAVAGDQPELYWRLNEATGSIARDVFNENPGHYEGNSTKGVSGALAGVDDTAVAFDEGLVASDNAVNNPRVYSLETWFNTTTNRGGKLIGFGNQSSGLSNSHDRHVYMQDDGHLVFGTYTGFTNTITTDSAYNDGRWHQVVATQSGDGMKLYVDGQLVGTNPQTDAEPYTGYWRIGGDNTWGSSTPWFNGKIDEAAVYSTALTAQKIKRHYDLGSAQPTPNSAPVAAFESQVTDLGIALDGSASTDRDGTIASYSWSFGDGRSGTGRNVSHAYATAGTYQVTLTVADDKGSTGELTASVTVSAANVGPNPEFTSTVSDLSIALDGSASTDTDGTVASYVWTFGDGATATGATTSHNYQAAGTYSVTLTVTDNRGATGQVSKSVTVTAPNVAPTAGFGSQAANLDAAFDGSASVDSDGTIASYAWVFGDGTSGTGRTVSHTYATAGTYQVTLTVTDDKGATGQITKPVLMTAPPAPNAGPTAGFSSSASGLVGSFDGSASADSDGTISSYAWAFGDGTTGTGRTTTRTYATAGTYQVTLTVTDDKGATGQITKPVTVTSPVTPPAANVLAQDGFGRTIASGWGTADVGGAWTITGAASALRVADGTGLATIPAGSTRTMMLNSVSSQSSDTTVSIALDKAPTGGGYYGTIIGRQVSTNSYLVKVWIKADGSVWLVTQQGNTVLNTTRVAGITYTAGTVLQTRFQVTGTAPTTLKSKVWTGATEPANWNVTVTDTTAALQTAGNVGLQTYQSASATSPTTTTYDNYTVTTVQ